MSKFSERLDGGGYVVKTTRGGVFCLGVRRSVNGNVTEKYGTAAKLPFIGNRGGNLTNAISLKNGRIDRQVTKTNTTDFSVASDLIRFDLAEDGFVQINYEMSVFQNEDEAKAFAYSEANTELKNLESEYNDALKAYEDFVSKTQSKGYVAEEDDLQTFDYK